MIKKLLLISTFLLVSTGILHSQIVDKYSAGISGNMSNIISDDIDDFRDYQFGYGIGFWARKNITPRLGLVSGLEFSAVRFQLDIPTVETTPDGTPTGTISRAKTTSSLFILSVPLLFHIDIPLGLYAQAGPRFDFEIASNNKEIDDSIIPGEDRLSDFTEFFTFGWSAGLGKKFGILGAQLDVGFRFNGDITDLVRDSGFADLKKHRVDLWIKLPLPF